MSLISCCLPRGAVSFPRVSGDEPWATKERPHYPAFSPRERG